MAFSLPREIIFDILVRVPIESLIEFKVVCKSWYAIIKDPQFIELHLIQHQKHLRYALFHRSKYNSNSNHYKKNHIYTATDELIEEVYKWNAIEEKNVFEDIKVNNVSEDGVVLGISGSCNGLLCVSPIVDVLDPCFICNLITRECVKLPVSEQPISVYSFHLEKRVTVSITDSNLFYFAFQEIGFGYDPLSKKYKLVRVFMIEFRDNFDIDYIIGEIMTMDGENIWRRFEFPYRLYLCNQPETLVLEGSVYWNIDGSVYWNRDSTSADSQKCLDDILALDLRDEKFRTIKYPPSVARNDYGAADSRYLMNLGGLLALVEGNYVLSHTRVWTMMDDNWMCLYTFTKPWLPLHINVYGHIVLVKRAKLLEDDHHHNHLSYYDTTKGQTFEIQVSGIPKYFQVDPVLEEFLLDVGFTEEETSLL